MKFWTFAGLLAGIVAITVAIRNCPKTPVMRSAERRYSIDELISDQEL